MRGFAATLCWFAVVAACRCGWADGGAVRAIEHVGRFQISVFTSPHPLVAGPADISVLVQDGESGRLVDDTAVRLTIAPRDRPTASITLSATAEAATNKLFRACTIELDPGWYDVLVTCDDGSDHGPAHGQVRFALEVGAEPAQMAALWPWFAWPLLPIVLFALHAVFAPRTSRRRGPRRLQ